MPYSMECPFGQSGSAVPLWPLPTPCAPSYSPHWWSRGGAENILTTSAAEAELKHPCLIKVVSSINPNQTPIPATVKKTNSIQHKTSAAGTSVRYTCRDKSQTASSPVEQQLLQRQCCAPLAFLFIYVTSVKSILQNLKSLMRLNISWFIFLFTGITLYSQPYGGALLDEDKMWANSKNVS